MNNPIVRRVIAVLSLTFFVLLGSSCVNEEYDMSGDNLNLEVTPFQGGLTLPLGSTEQIKLKDLLKDLEDSDNNILGSFNGAYSIRMSDKIDMTGQLASITDLVNISGIDDVYEPVTFSLNGVNLSTLRVPKQDYDFPVDVPTGFTVPDVKMPEESSRPQEIKFGVDVPKFDAEQLAFNVGPITRGYDVLTIDRRIQDALSNPVFSVIPENEPIDLFRSEFSSFITETPTFTVDVPFDVDIVLPKALASVDNIVLEDGAKIKISLALDKAFLHSGTITPGFTLDLSELCEVKGNPSGEIDLGEALKLSEASTPAYSSYVEYDITSLKLADAVLTEVNGECHLRKSMNATIDGEVTWSNMKTTKALLADSGLSVMGLDFELEVVGLIDDMDVSINPVEIKDMEEEVELKFDPIQIPEQVKKLQYADFTPDPMSADPKSGINIRVDIDNLGNVPGFGANLSTLEIVFPDEFVIEDHPDVANNVLSLSNVPLIGGFEETVYISRFNVPAPVGGYINYAEMIKVNATAEVSGKNIHIKDLPTEDVNVVVTVTPTFNLYDYGLSLNPITQTIAMEPKDITVGDIPKELAGKTFVVYPDGDAKIVIDLGLPADLPVEVTSSAGDVMSISFPEMLVFDVTDLPAGCTYREGKITFGAGESIPNHMELPIKKMNVSPVLKNPDDESCVIEGKVEISGSITIVPKKDSGNPNVEKVLTKADVDRVLDLDQILVKASIPEDIIPATMDIDNYETTISQTIDLDMMEPADVPEQLVEVGLIELSDAVINMSMDATSLPDLNGAKLAVELEVILPEILEVEGAENGVLKMTKELGPDKKMVFDPIEITAIDLSGVDIKANGIKEVITVNGDIILSDASLDVNSWLGKTHEVGISATVSELKIATVGAKVDYAIETEPVEVDLSEVSSMMGDMGVEANLDFKHAHLALDVKTNLGVPVSADVEIIPYYNDVAKTEGVVKATLNLEPKFSTETGREHVPVENVSKFWLAEKEDNRCPAGYTLVEVNNLLNLFKEIPDKLEINVVGGTDKTKECHLDLSVDQILTIDYAFELPLEFGEEFELTYEYTISELPEILGSVLATGNKVRLGGNISNSLPLGLNLSFEFLDSEGKVVPSAKDCGYQEIAPCNLDGTAYDTELKVTLGLEEGVDASDIASLKLVFNANSGGITGVGVTEDAFLQAVLKVELPEGLTVDLKDLMNNEQ